MVRSTRGRIRYRADARACSLPLEISLDVGFEQAKAHAVHAIFGLVAGKRETIL